MGIEPIARSRPISALLSSREASAIGVRISAARGAPHGNVRQLIGMVPNAYLAHRGDRFCESVR